jgi:hypothetical protein
MPSPLANVRFGSKTDICSAKRHVRFTPKSGHGVAPSEQMSFAVAAMASGRGPGEDRLRARCVPQLKFCSLGVRMILFDLGDAEPPQQARQLADARRVRRARTVCGACPTPLTGRRKSCTR